MGEWVRAPFGFTAGGEEVSAWTIRAGEYSARVLSYGGVLQSFSVGFADRFRIRQRGSIQIQSDTTHFHPFLPLLHPEAPMSAALSYGLQTISLSFSFARLSHRYSAPWSFSHFRRSR